ncbi:hypothetical protein BD311DRAFT_466204 [Dichomitus squalens]|uniref:Uncharacterized protein n=1 Tax=Dichomitus squalens TaxID=114155 RepID=A0A4Q9MFG4_9APHY|nr:hypothetical protein BD311DRAFT_466204 [Dichomitus squalens]
MMSAFNLVWIGPWAGCRSSSCFGTRTGKTARRTRSLLGCSRLKYIRITRSFDNCWDYVAQASEMMATRDANRTSTSAPISRRSPLSTGPAIDDSTTMPPSTRSSVSAPPPR